MNCNAQEILFHNDDTDLIKYLVIYLKEIIKISGDFSIFYQFHLLTQYVKNLYRGDVY